MSHLTNNMLRTMGFKGPSERQRKAAEEKRHTKQLKPGDISDINASMGLGEPETDALRRRRSRRGLVSSIATQLGVGNERLGGG